MITKNLVVKIENLVVNHESRHVVHFCPNFQIFCPFLSFFNIFCLLRFFWKIARMLLPSRIGLVGYRNTSMAWNGLLEDFRPCSEAFQNDMELFSICCKRLCKSLDKEGKLFDCHYCLLDMLFLTKQFCWNNCILFVITIGRSSTCHYGNYDCWGKFNFIISVMDMVWWW